VRFRRLGALVAAAALCAVGLAGCRTNVGTAASVGTMRISESDVNRYVTTAGPAPSVVSQARTQGQDVAPKSEVLQYLIQDEVFRKALAAHGGVPNAGALAASQNAAAKLLFQTQLTGSALTKALAQGLTRSGIRASFAQRYLTVQTLEYTLITRQQLSQFAQLAALVNKAGARVSVSSRYGKWDRASLQLDRAKAVPSFLKLQPTPGASSSASTAPTGGGS
jgi:hypothetical protein